MRLDGSEEHSPDPLQRRLLLQVPDSSEGKGAQSQECAGLHSEGVQLLVQFGKSMKLGFHEDFTNHTKVAVAVRPLLQDGKRAIQFQVSITAVSF